MDPLTNENGTAKRTRFDSSVSPPTDTELTTNSPMAVAVRHIEAHVASLHPEIATILSKLAKTHLLLLTKADNKKRQIERMSNDAALIPRSARVKFEFKTSKQAEQDPEFIVLREETNAVITEFQSHLKSKIIAVAKIEERLLRLDIPTDLATALRLATKAFLVCDGTTNPATADKMVNTILDRYHETLLKNCGLSLAAFRAVYKTTHGLASLPDPFVHPATQEEEDDGMSLFARGITRQFPAAATNMTAEDKEAGKIFRALSSTFVMAFAMYTTTQKKNAIKLALKQLATEHFDSAATADAAMEIDTEPSADRPQLENLITTQVDKKTKSMAQELKSLRAAVAKLSTTTPLQPKNKPRGSQSKDKSASAKKSGRNPRSPTPPRKQNRRAAAAVADNASSDGKTKPSKTRSNPKSRKRPPKSKNKPTRNKGRSERESS